MSANLRSDDHSPVTAGEESTSAPGNTTGISNKLGNGGGGGGGGGDGSGKDRLAEPAAAMGPRAGSGFAGAGGAGDNNGGMSNGMPPSVLSQPSSSSIGMEEASSNGKADLSSDDIDVMTTSDSPDKKSLQQQQQMPEPNLKERLRRVRLHVVNPLFKHSKSIAFREPVNAKALGIYPIYHQIIKRPMDLGTVRKKIDRGEYFTRQQCVDDIFLIWTNGKTFNAPGHFVHENAKILEGVTRDKLARLERDEEAGIFDQPKPPKKAPELAVRPRDEPRPERRMSRKISTELPGESMQPQQLKKKYVESLDDQMKKCDSILKELLTARLHQAYVEPFLQCSRGPDSMDLYKVQQRLQNGYYRHPLQFAGDFRSIITSAYKSASDPEDPLLRHASNLQHNFELLFAHVEYEPVPNPALFDRMGDSETGMLGGLIAAQNQVGQIQANVTSLLSDLIQLRRQDVASRRKRQRGGAAGPSRAGGNAGGRKRGRPVGSTNKAPKQRRPPKPPVKGGAAMTEAERMALRGEIAELKEDQQGHVVQLMMDNGEVLSQDANGYTEIDLGNCSAATIKLIQDYIARAKRAAAKAASSASKKRKRQRKESSSESSDSSEDDEDDSSSSASSSGDSDSD